MKVALPKNKRVKSLVFVAALLSAFAPLLAQDPREVQMPAPPPLKFLPRFEREQLNAAKDAKDRIRLSIELAEGHLLQAEGLTTAKRNDACLIELGSYMALVDDSMKFLAGMKRDSNRTRDLYKRLELALRAHGMRLAAIRRITPAEYAGQIKAVEEYARNVRTDALESFYGDTVLREATVETKEGSGDKPAKEPSPGGSKRP
jgi:hypothetical protein